MIGSLHRPHFAPSARPLLPLFVVLSLALALSQASLAAAPQAKAAHHRPKYVPKSAHKTKSNPDVLVLKNGDRLTGRFLRALGGKVFFHSPIVGDIGVQWSQIRELKTSTRLVVFQKAIFQVYGAVPRGIPQGTLIVQDGVIWALSKEGIPSAPISVKKAQYIVDEKTLIKQISGHPGFFQAWNGSLTGGASIVQATQNQYTFFGSLSLTRTVPTVGWLNTRDRTILNASGSFGQIIQPAYSAGGTLVPSSRSKSAIYHAAAERDEYFSPEFYALMQTTFDHNYGQALNLQQVYGSGIGWTALRRPTQELDLKLSLQYVSQSFLQTSSQQNQNLIGSTLSANWTRKLPHNIQFTQQASWLPAFNNTKAYSASEINSATMPFFKNLSFSVGTNDSYLNDPPAAIPPTRRNSFQFTTGLSYAVHSTY